MLCASNKSYILSSLLIVALAVLGVWLSSLIAPASHPLLLPSSSTDLDIERTSEVIERFAGMLRLKTISSTRREHKAKYAQEFKALHRYMRSSWPIVFQKLQVQEVCFCSHSASPVIDSSKMQLLDRPSDLLAFCVVWNKSERQAAECCLQLSQTLLTRQQYTRKDLYCDTFLK